MKAGIFFTGSGPILLLTSFDSLEAPGLVEKLKAKGVKKYIACEVSEEMVKERYGNHYNVVMGDLQSTASSFETSASPSFTRISGGG